MNILFVNNIFPLFAHADSGASVRSMRLINALAKLGHVDVISFLDNEVSNLPNCDVIYSGYVSEEFARWSRIKKVKFVLQQYNWYDIWPLNKPKKDIIDRLISAKKYDIIVVRYMKMACECGLLEYAGRLIIDVDDDPKAVARMFNRAKKWYKKIFWHYIYANAVDRITNDILKKTKAAFNSQPEKTYPNTYYLPNISMFTEPLSVVDFKSVPKNILFVGRMDHMPNVKSLRHFLSNIFPLVLQKNASVYLRVVGLIENPDLLNLCQSIPNVVLCGFVEDIKEEYRQCRCAVIPLMDGTGTSVKLIEAMSLNRAVVTTSVGKRGLHKAFVNGEDYLLADKDEDFANEVVRLINDETLNRQISTNAQAKVEKYYSENSFNEIVKRAIV